MRRNIFNRRSALACLAGVATAFIAPDLPAKGRAAARLVTEFHKSLLAIMRMADTLEFDGRYARLKPSMENSFHLPIMAQIAIGSFWRKASPDQQKQLIQVFSDVSIGTYVNRFSNFSGQSFETKITRVGPQKTILVDTVLKNPPNADVVLTYVCREISGSWGVIDVLLNAGISKLAMWRSEYRRILKTDGIDGLITKLEQKAWDLRSSN